MLIAYSLPRHEIAQMAGELQLPPQRLSFQWLALAITTALYHWPLQTPGTFPSGWHCCTSRRALICCPYAERALIQEPSNRLDPSTQ